MYFTLLTNEYSFSSLNNQGPNHLIDRFVIEATWKRFLSSLVEPSCNLETDLNHVQPLSTVLHEKNLCHLFVS